MRAGAEWMAQTDSRRFLEGGGALGELMRAFDWRTTSLGPIAGWPQSLKTAVGIVLRSPVPIVLLWGEDGVMIYNDAYAVFAGGRHPRLLGLQGARGVARGRRLQRQRHEGRLGRRRRSSYSDQELTLYRNGRPEQVWMNLDYSPVLDENGPAGRRAGDRRGDDRTRAGGAAASPREGERLRELFEQAPGFMRHPGAVPTTCSRSSTTAYLAARRPAGDDIGKPSREAFAEIAARAIDELLDQRLRDRGAFRRPRHAGQTAAGAAGRWSSTSSISSFSRSATSSGEVTGIFAEGSTTSRAGCARRTIERLLIDELNHRVKNTLATVQSIAVADFPGGGEAAVDASRRAREMIDVRLFALSRAHDVLTRENWDGAGLRAMVNEVILAYRGNEDALFEVEGPAARLTSKMALTIAMALHELCTNAAKYGALSLPSGRVSIRWWEEETVEGRVLRLVWRERGGPPVLPPTRRGFGSRLIERQLAREFGGQVVLDFEPGGVVCTMAIPFAPGTPADLPPVTANAAGP